MTHQKMMLSTTTQRVVYRSLPLSQLNRVMTQTFLKTKKMRNPQKAISTMKIGMNHLRRQARLLRWKSLEWRMSGVMTISESNSKSSHQIPHTNLWKIYTNLLENMPRRKFSILKIQPRMRKMMTRRQLIWGLRHYLLLRRRKYNQVTRSSLPPRNLKNRMNLNTKSGEMMRAFLLTMQIHQWRVTHLKQWRTQIQKACLWNLKMLNKSSPSQKKEQQNQPQMMIILKIAIAMTGVKRDILQHQMSKKPKKMQCGEPTTIFNNRLVHLLKSNLSLRHARQKLSPRTRNHNKRRKVTQILTQMTISRMPSFTLETTLMTFLILTRASLRITQAQRRRAPRHPARSLHHQKVPISRTPTLSMQSSIRKSHL
mmetsp:Transcript_10885/g.40590  ORF Transcript_10885/g.40590 Transcript_10885/m.40590 type:complete len:369 (-) Transcript_10885:1480-2586(-)